MNFDIAIFYREDMPEQMVLDLAQDLRNENVNVETEKRPNEPVAMIEWAVPAIVIFIASQYAGGFLKELGKDHYTFVKEKFYDLVSNASKIKQQKFVSSNSPNKLLEENSITGSFAFWSQTLDGRSIKFLFLGDRDKDYYDICTEEVLKTLQNHAEHYPSDNISTQVEKLIKKPNEIYMLFDENSKQWKVVDNVTRLLGDENPE